ncbi:hypothetical protein ACFL4C_02390 [Candidatus Omnitrophota bacterium]
MRKITLSRENFQFENFTNAILDFHGRIAPEGVKPSTYLLKVDSEGYADWGPDEGWDNFLQVLSQGQRIYFPFSLTNCGESIECANGEDYELGEETEICLGETDTVGFIIGLYKDRFIIQSATCAGGGPPAGLFVEVGNCDVFDMPMKLFIDKFKSK